MIFNETPLAGAYLIEPEKRGDERGFFARVFCVAEFAALGLERGIAQVNVSRSVTRGTLRGMHYQLAPKAESKIVRCTRGALYDVILDLRPDSATFGQWFGHELTEENHHMLFVPKGCAHGFLSLTDQTEICYLVSEAHSPGHERGIRYDDPRFGIRWPAPPAVVSAKDSAWPPFDPGYHLGGGA